MPSQGHLPKAAFYNLTPPSRPVNQLQNSNYIRTIIVTVQTVSAPMEPSLLLLPPDLLRRVASLLPPNTVALCLRPTCRTLAQVLAGPRHTTVTLSQPACPKAFDARWGAPGATQRLTLRQRYHLLRLTAASGVVQNFNLLHQQPSCQRLDKHFEYADLALPVEGAPENYSRCSEACLLAAAAAGQADMCRWLLRQLGPFYHVEMAVLRAAVAGHMEALQVLMEHLRKQGWSWPGLDAWTSSGSAEAALDGLLYWDKLRMELRAAGLRGNEAYVAWLLQHRRPGPFQRRELEPLVARVVAEGCSLAFLQRVLGECYGQGEVGAEVGADEQQEGGLLAASREWREVLVSWRVGLEGALEGAAGSPMSDWRDRVEWVLQQEQGQGQGLGVPAQQQLGACVAAARCPDAVERLRWLAGRGFLVACSQAACEAVAHGRTEAVVYLLDELGVQLEREAGDAAMLQAARSGRLSTLQALHERGYHMPGSAAKGAVWEGHVQVAEWVLGVLTGPAWLHLTPDAFVQAALWEDWPMLQLLLRVRCPRPSEGGLAWGAEPSEETLAWLAKRRCAYYTVSSCTLELHLAIAFLLRCGLSACGQRMPRHQAPRAVAHLSDGLMASAPHLQGTARIVLALAPSSTIALFLALYIPAPTTPYYTCKGRCLPALPNPLSRSAPRSCSWRRWRSGRTTPLTTRSTTQVRHTTRSCGRRGGGGG